MLVDQFNRRFTYLRLSITDTCNFRCNYCLPDGYCANDKDAPLNVEEISALIKAFALNGTRKVRITGGEPTLRKDLADIISACKRIEGIETVALTSNGYRLTKQIDSYIDAGLDHLNLSADSLRPSTFKLITGHDKLREVLDSIEIARSRGIRKIKLNAVLLKEFNHEELSMFMNFVRDKDISVRFIELMETGDNKPFFDQQHVRGEEIQNKLIREGWVQKIREPNAGPAIEFKHPDYAGNIGLIMPYSKDFCATCNRLRISSEGKLHLCLFADDNLDLRPYLLEESTEALAARIRSLVQNKFESHHLDQGATGSTRHLAMLGG